ncbi:hypothetical protein SCUCBS95973_008857 [Sporothrix curviconia]|uniref:Protein BIG1 n=1 Tax=Sporothrix curviconia TaxID=1260050 RepID=A0ABP0CQ42_9PEZI
MRASILAGLLAAGSAHAFTDSSPFLLFSTSDLPVDSVSTSQLQITARVIESAKALLADCPTSKYLLVAQPNVHTSDLYLPPYCEAHRLRRALANDAVHGRYSVSEAVAKDGMTNMTLDDFAAHIKAACSAANNGGEDASSPQIDQLALPALPVALTCHGRSEAMGDNDYVLGNTLDDALALGDVTVVYFSTGGAGAHGKYEATFDDDQNAGAAQVPVHKRMVSPQGAVRQVAAPFKDRDTRGLFEKYQFFTPGIFMSLIVFFIVLSILYVGLSAVSSLQVPYGAFDKEMGPAAQKKQQ